MTRRAAAVLLLLLMAAVGGLVFLNRPSGTSRRPRFRLFLRVTPAPAPATTAAPGATPRAAGESVRLGNLPQLATDVEVRTVLSPPWTTDWITEDGRRKLAGSGIAPPGVRLLPLLSDQGTAGRPEVCPHCGSTDVEELAGFGSTACKALWRCTSCREPFDYLKAH